MREGWCIYIGGKRGRGGNELRKERQVWERKRTRKRGRKRGDKIERGTACGERGRK